MPNDRLSTRVESSLRKERSRERNEMIAQTEKNQKPIKHLTISDTPFFDWTIWLLIDVCAKTDGNVVVLHLPITRVILPF